MNPELEEILRDYRNDLKQISINPLYEMGKNDFSVEDLQNAFKESLKDKKEIISNTLERLNELDSNEPNFNKYDEAIKNGLKNYLQAKNEVNQTRLNHADKLIKFATERNPKNINKEMRTQIDKTINGEIKEFEEKFLNNEGLREVIKDNINQPKKQKTNEVFEKVLSEINDIEGDNVAPLNTEINASKSGLRGLS